MPPSGNTFFALPEMGGEQRDPDTIFSHYMPGAMDQTLLKNAVSMSVSAEQRSAQIVVDVTIINDQTGHHVPTDSPLRQLILLVEARDNYGEPLILLNGPTVPEWGGVGDPAQGYYAGLPGKGYAKILKESWTGIVPSGAYWNPTVIISDNRLAAFMQDTNQFSFSIPEGEAVIVDVRLYYRRAFIDLITQKGWNLTDILLQQSVVAVPLQ